MNRAREESSSDERKAAEEAEKNRRQMDEIPEPGPILCTKGPEGQRSAARIQPSTARCSASPRSRPSFVRRHSTSSPVRANS